MTTELSPPATFTTARLEGRPPTAEDAVAAFNVYASDPTVTRYLAWPPYTDTAPLAAFFATQAAVWRGESPGPCAWLLTRRDDGALLGSVGVELTAGKAMIGYVLGRAHWGHGYMTEALRWLVDWALAQPSIHRAWAFCDVENPASARVMERAGMTREGILRRWHVCPTIGPEPRDCIVCAKVR